MLATYLGESVTCGKTITLWKVSSGVYPNPQPGWTARPDYKGVVAELRVGKCGQQSRMWLPLQGSVELSSWLRLSAGGW